MKNLSKVISHAWNTRLQCFTTQTRRLTLSLLAEQENDLDTVITRAAARFQVIPGDSILPGSGWHYLNKKQRFHSKIIIKQFILWYYEPKSEELSQHPQLCITKWWLSPKPSLYDFHTFVILIILTNKSAAFSSKINIWWFHRLCSLQSA